MSKGREIFFTKAISRDKCDKVEPFPLQDMGDKRVTSQLTGAHVSEVEEAESPQKLTAEQIEEIQQAAYQEAFEQGLEEGRKQGLSEGQQQISEKVQQFESLLGSLNTPFQELDDEVVDQIVTMVITMGKHLIRRELKIDPGQIVATVREAVGALPVASRDVHLHLNPEDARLIRETLQVSDEQSRWQIHEDPSMTRGGVKVLTENSQIDATVETRLSEIISQAFGDERGQESEES